MSYHGFPAIGHMYEVRFGETVFTLDFDADGRSMTFKKIGANDPRLLDGETIAYTAVPIRPGVFVVHWQEKNGTTVTHVEDFDNGIVHVNITQPDKVFINLSGTSKRLG